MLLTWSVEGYTYSNYLCSNLSENIKAINSLVILVSEGHLTRGSRPVWDGLGGQSVVEGQPYAPVP